MHSFPRADIHELLSPDLLHQVIKGVFKDHIVEWVLAYIRMKHAEKDALEIIEDIDHWYYISLLFFFCFVTHNIVLFQDLSCLSIPWSSPVS